MACSQVSRTGRSEGGGRLRERYGGDDGAGACVDASGGQDATRSLEEGGGKMRKFEGMDREKAARSKVANGGKVESRASMWLVKS